MQTCTCEITLNGDHNHVVVRHGVTPPEILLLQHIHGGQAVRNIKPGKMDKRSHQEELNRLKARYDRRGKLVAEVFPGSNPKLPVSLKDIGIETGKASGKAAEQAEDEAPAGEGI